MLRNGPTNPWSKSNSTEPPPEPGHFTTELADLLNDDGTIDSQKLDRAITAAAKEFGIPTGLHVPEDVRTPQVPAGGQFSDAFRPAGR